MTTAITIDITDDKGDTFLLDFFFTANCLRDSRNVGVACVASRSGASYDAGGKYKTTVRRKKKNKTQIRKSGDFLPEVDDLRIDHRESLRFRYILAHTRSLH